jgi:hypothetical protein
MHTGVLILAATLAPADAVGPTDGVTPPKRAELSDPTDGIQGEWVVVTYLLNARDHGVVSGSHVTFTSEKVIDKTRSEEVGYRLDRSAWPPADRLNHCGRAGG